MDYTSSSPWDIIWSRPYKNYEHHHQVFWKKIREYAEGSIVDLACGSSSCWRDHPCDLTGIDFSIEAIHQSKLNCPWGLFFHRDITATCLLPDKYDTVILCGVVNYYHDLTNIMEEVMRIVRPGGMVIITINVIDDFPDRHWDEKRINMEFGAYGKVTLEFFKGIGWLLVISISP